MRFVSYQSSSPEMPAEKECTELNAEIGSRLEEALRKVYYEVSTSSNITGLSGNGLITFQRFPTDEEGTIGIDIFRGNVAGKKKGINMYYRAILGDRDFPYDPIIFDTLAMHTKGSTESSMDLEELIESLNGFYLAGQEK